jgi:trehalose synthase
MTTARLDAYREVAPRGSLDILLRLAERLRGRRFVHVNASRFGAGSPEILDRLVPMLQDLGIDAAWEVIVGDPEFYAAARRIDRGLAGLDESLTEAALRAYRETAAANAAALRLEAHLVMVHDVAALALAQHRVADGRWVWRCHQDLSRAYPRVWYAVRGDAERYDAAVFSLPKFAQRLAVPMLIVHPSLDPLGDRNRDMTRREIDQWLERLSVPRDKPIVLSVGPYAASKDVPGAIRAYRLAKKYVDCRLVLAGWGAADNPEGSAVLAQAREAAAADPDILPLVLPPDAGLHVNALQRAAAVLLHKPLQDDFGLVVAEAMWKGKPVVASLVGGMPAQVIHEVTGYGVTSVEGAAFRIRQLLDDADLRARLGGAGREYVRRTFLVTRHLGDYLALLATLAG